MNRLDRLLLNKLLEEKQKIQERKNELLAQLEKLRDEEEEIDRQIYQEQHKKR